MKVHPTLRRTFVHHRTPQRPDYKGACGSERTKEIHARTHEIKTRAHGAETERELSRSSLPHIPTQPPCGYKPRKENRARIGNNEIGGRVPHLQGWRIIIDGSWTAPMFSDIVTGQNKYSLFEIARRRPGNLPPVVLHSMHEELNWTSLLERAHGGK